MFTSTLADSSDPSGLFAHSIYGIIIALFCIATALNYWRRRWPGLRSMVRKHGFTTAEPRPKLNAQWQMLAAKTDGPRKMELQGILDEDCFGKGALYRLMVQPRASGGLKFTFEPVNVEGQIRWVLGTFKLPTGDPKFDKAWSIDTNQDEFLKEALVPELRALFAGIAKPMRHNRISLEDGVIAIMDNAYLRPPERFEHALQLAEALAEVAERFAARS